MGYLRRRVTSREDRKIKVTISNPSGYNGSCGANYKGVWYNGVDTPSSFKCLPDESITVMGAASGFASVRILTVTDADGTVIYSVNSDDEGHGSATYTRVVPRGVYRIEVSMSGASIMGMWYLSESYREYRRGS